jgi:hypothetical protein
MHTSHEEPHDPTKNYETRDLPMKGIVRGVIIFFAFTLAAAPAAWLVMLGLGASPGKPYFGQEPIPMQDATSYQSRRIPGGDNPLLQDNVTARADMHNLRKRENELLEQGGVNPTTKRQTIPIGEAMQMEAAQQGN